MPQATAQERRLAPLGALALLGIALLAVGCEASAPSSRPRPEPLAEGKGAIVVPQIGPAVRTARLFAAAYGRDAYSPVPPPLPGATAAVRRTLRLAAARVPPARRRLQPRAVDLIVHPRGSSELVASVEIGDGRSPRFSVGFTVRRFGDRWLVVAISPPG